MFKQTDLIAIFGRRGTGKTTMCRTIQGAFPRLIIVDLLQEYQKADCDYLVDSFESFGQVLLHITRTQQKRFKIVFQFDVENSSAAQDDFDRAMRLIYYFGNCMVVIEEIHQYTQREHMPVWLKNTILVGRHRGVGILATSQRPAEVPKTFVSQCHHVFCGVSFEKNDIKYFQETVGEVADKISTLKPHYFLHHQPGFGTQTVYNLGTNPAAPRARRKVSRTVKSR